MWESLGWSGVVVVASFIGLAITFPLMLRQQIQAASKARWVARFLLGSEETASSWRRHEWMLHLVLGLMAVRAIFDLAALVFLGYASYVLITSGQAGISLTSSIYYALLFGIVLRLTLQLATSILGRSVSKRLDSGIAAWEAES